MLLHAMVPFFLHWLRALGRPARAHGYMAQGWMGWLHHQKSMQSAFHPPILPSRNLQLEETARIVSPSFDTVRYSLLLLSVAEPLCRHFRL